MRLAFLLVAALCGVACSHPAVCTGGELAAAKDAAAERTAFQHIAKECGSLSLAAFDKKSTPLPLSDPAWTAKVHVIRIGAGGKPFEHTVIDGKNALVLVNE